MKIMPECQALSLDEPSLVNARISEMKGEIARGRAFLQDTQHVRSASLQAIRESIQRRIKFYESEIMHWEKLTPREVRRHPAARPAR